MKPLLIAVIVVAGAAGIVFSAVTAVCRDVGIDW